MNPKKCLTFLLSLCLLFCVTVQASAEEKEQSEEKVRISSLSSEECTEKLSELGVAIPRELNGINIQEVVAAFEADPGFYSVVNYTVANDFFKDVRHAINRYHDWPDKVYDTTASTSKTLFKKNFFERCPFLRCSQTISITSILEGEQRYGRFKHGNR